MDIRADQEIKTLLESTFDIPFVVKRSTNYEDILYIVSPESEDEDLFSISVKIRNRLRIVIEVSPEKYAAFSINDMANASAEKKAIFSGYANQLYARKAKIDFFINNTPYNPVATETWPDSWENYRIRISRSPITNEGDSFNEIDITGAWLSIVTGMFLSLLDIVPTQSQERTEGGVKTVTLNRYERNPVNRELCLAANGYTCKICGFDFEKIYGSLGHHFIHVHHIVPVSQMKEAYHINPVTELIPVCPNCHAMLHRTDPPLHPENLKSIIVENGK